MDANSLYNLAMTSDTYTDANNDTFIASASSVYSASAPAYIPFNGAPVSNDCWHPNSGVPQWLKLQLPRPAKIFGFTIKNRVGYVEHPTAITFQGSNDDANWDDLGTISWTEAGIGLVKQVIIPTYTTNYLYFRWYITGVTSSPYGVIANITFTDVYVPSVSKFLIESQGNYYALISDVLTNVGTTLNAQLFADYGMNAIPDYADYSSLTFPSILAWNADEDIPMTAVTTGVPTYPQTVISQNIEMISPTITGVDSVDIDSDDDTLFAMSFDDGSTWYNYVNNQWVLLTTSTAGQDRESVEDIPTNAWNAKVTNRQLKFRFSLLDENGYVTQIKVNYTN